MEQNNLNPSDLSIEIHSTKKPADGHHQGRFHRPTAPEISLLLPNEIPQNAKRTIICSMRGQSGQYNLREFQDYHRSYDPLQYPLLFPYGTDGWHLNFQGSFGHKKPSANQFVKYKIITRPNNHLLDFGKIFQQYLVDQYAKIELKRLRFIRDNQTQLRANLYKGV